MDSAIKSIKVQNFTVFPEATFEFSPQLNVIAGENGSGKSHLLKLAYCIVDAMSHKQEMYTLSDLMGSVESVFGISNVGFLVSRFRGVDIFSEPQANVGVSFLNSSSGTTFSIVDQGMLADSLQRHSLEKRPVFMPTREMLSIFPNFIPLYEKSDVEFDRTWRDICIHLGFPPDRELTSPLLPVLEKLMGGKIILENGRFYLDIPGQEKMEMHLVAEGHRKLGMVARLVANGSLASGTHLFWDEPEANLNPKIIKKVAEIILHLCNSGVQVFIATHSLFLMRELDILLQTPQFSGTKARFFGLQRGEKGYHVEQGDDIDSMGDIAALNEELVQSDRYLEVANANNNRG